MQWHEGVTYIFNQCFFDPLGCQPNYQLNYIINVRTTSVVTIFECSHQQEPSLVKYIFQLCIYVMLLDRIDI